MCDTKMSFYQDFTCLLFHDTSFEFYVKEITSVITMVCIPADINTKFSMLYDWLNRTQKAQFREEHDIIGEEGHFIAKR